MNTGTNTPLSIDHDVTGDGTSSVISATNMNDIIINGIPVIFAFEIKFAEYAAITLPMFVSLNTEINVDAKNKYRN